MTKIEENTAPEVISSVTLSILRQIRRGSEEEILDENPISTQCQAPLVEAEILG